ncbi:MAG: exodeoxyribonuclease VII small subunit [Phycisphaerales bacterium]|jgi:exodeoxyribonuclease VII small subunit
MSGKKSDESDVKLSFEDAVKQLEAIIERIEGGEIGLEDSLKEYEKGMRLHAHCVKVLEQAELRLEELKSKDEG